MAAPDVRTLIGPDAPDILQEFGAILEKRNANRVLDVMKQADGVLQQAYAERVRELTRQGHLPPDARAVAKSQLMRWVEQIVESRDYIIEEETRRFRGAVVALLEWWQVTRWNPDNRAPAQ